MSLHEQDPQILFRRCCGAAVARVIQPCACKLVRPFVAVIAAVAAIPDTQPSTTFCELSEEATARLDLGDLWQRGSMRSGARS